MNPRYLLDTNICIYIVRNRPPGIARRFTRLLPGSVGMSLVTWGELRYGAEKSTRRAEALTALDRLSESIPVLEPDRNTAVHYGLVRAALERAGTPIGNNDLWIASHALSLGVTLVTNDTEEFRRVPRLRLENWA